MGMLGLSLVFVGIVLVSNGLNRLTGVDGKSIAVMNLFTGFILVTGNLIMLSRAGVVQDYQNVASGYLFGFTYLFIAANYLFKLDLRPFGWFSGFVAVYAVVMCVNVAGADGWLAVLWGAWAVLWLEGFLELGLKLKIGKIFPYLSMAEGVFAAFIPAVIMLLGKW
jgi:acid-activated urea channel